MVLLAAGDSPKKVRVIFQPSGLRVMATSGTDLLTAGRAAGLHMGGVCGGAGTCGKCRVLLVDGRKRRSVLACRHVLGSSITVEVPDSALSGAAQILEDGVYVEMEPLPNARILAEAGKTFLVLGEDGEKIPLRVRPKGCFGVALDMGTTTLVASLFDLGSGRRLAVASAINPQVAMGEDVISRIGLAIGDPKASGELRMVLIAGLNTIIRKACKEARVPAGEIFDICAVGNTYMHHSFLGLPVKGLGEAPYEPALTAEKELLATGTGVRVNSKGRAFLPPVIAGFLGSDALAGALAAGLDRVEAPTLYIDLGTNGEILLAHDGNIMGATSASGPAFEGAQIECGMRAREGAINAVKIGEKGAGSMVQGPVSRRMGAGGRLQGTGDGAQGKGLRGPGTRDIRYRIEVETIGGKPARGIAGSGLVDAVAALLDSGALDRRGGLSRAHTLVECEARGPVVVICRRPRKIYISQPDIRNLQLAKAAVAAGTMVLLEKAGMDVEELDRVLLAGAFGNYMDRRSAQRIGLLPPVKEQQVLGLGNAASTGAGMMLISMNERRRARELAKKIQYVELSGNERFRELFVDCLAFP